MRVAVAALLIACRGTSGEPARPPPPTTDVERWLAEFPPRCLADAPVELPSACPPANDPPGACIVERVDLVSGLRTDRFIFDRARLVRHEQILSSLEQHTRILSYDARGRWIRELACGITRAGTPAAVTSWHEPSIVLEPDETVSATERVYDGDARRPSLIDHRMVWRRKTGVRTSHKTRCLTFDHDRRQREYEVWRNSDEPGQLWMIAEQYFYERGRLVQIASRTRQLEAGHFTERMFDTVTFGYDGRGLRAWVRSSNDVTRYAFDLAGRLIASDGARLAWDGPRIAAIRSMKNQLDRTYTYEPGGRLADARYANGGGYHMRYSATCAPDLAHSDFTPNIDELAYWEGKDP
ncbi:MAG TPA: hypothetical protein VFQ53_15860 [Kofleriaceae bacterium]|nr:hypothetical protein [Kofleriaceae bacterium]